MVQFGVTTPKEMETSYSLSEGKILIKKIWDSILARYSKCTLCKRQTRVEDLEKYNGYCKDCYAWVTNYSNEDSEYFDPETYNYL